MAVINLYKYAYHVDWDTTGRGVNIPPSGGAIGFDIASYLVNYYTKVELQTSGSSQVHFDNIIEAYHNNLLDLQGGLSTSSGDSSGKDAEYYHLDESTYLDVINISFINSIVKDSINAVSLVNDLDSPGNSKYYGTNGVGTKGWFDLPASTDCLWEELSDGMLAPANSNIVDLYILGDIHTDDDDSNTKLGVGALSSITDGYSNIAIGKNALSSNTTGPGNIAIGEDTLHTNTGAQANIAIGYQALYANTTGELNVAIGMYSLLANTEGNYNISIGYNPMHNNTTGYSNIGIGGESLFTNTTGYTNTAIGFRSLYSNTTGYSNTSIGIESLIANTTGFYNVGIGFGSLSNCTTGNYNIGIGFESNLKVNSDVNEIVIGNEVIGQGSNTTIIGGIDTIATYLVGEIYFVDYDSGSVLSGSLPLADSSDVLYVVTYNPDTGKLGYTQLI